MSLATITYEYNSVVFCCFAQFDLKLKLSGRNFPWKISPKVTLTLVVIMSSGCQKRLKSAPHKGPSRKSNEKKNIAKILQHGSKDVSKINKWQRKFSDCFLVLQLVKPESSLILLVFSSRLTGGTSLSETTLLTGCNDTLHQFSFAFAGLVWLAEVQHECVYVCMCPCTCVSTIKALENQRGKELRC